MIDRNIRPAIHPFSSPVLLDHTIKILDNGVELIMTDDPSQEVFKMDIMFKAGAVYQPKPLVATSSVNMLGEGTSRRTSEQISELFDYYGAYIEENVSMVHSELSLLGLCKYAESVIDLTGEMITDSIFPEKEFEIFLKNRCQSFLVQQEKTSYLARKEFMSRMFGPKHPFANAICKEDFLSVTREDAFLFYKKRFVAENCKIYLSGNISGKIQDCVEKVFSSLPRSEKLEEIPLPAAASSPAGRYNVEKKNAAQSSIRIGKKGVTLTDPDYPEFMLLNTILGGYFCSRLMSNIREEKGYTYGIQSCNLPLPGTASWFIAADVNRETKEDAIAECLSEMQKIRTVPVSDEEFARARQYLHGELLRELDGVFAQSDMLKHKISFGTDLSIYERIIKSISASSPERIRELAERHLNPDECYIVSAG